MLDGGALRGGTGACFRSAGNWKGTPGRGCGGGASLTAAGLSARPDGGGVLRLERWLAGVARRSADLAHLCDVLQEDRRIEIWDLPRASQSEM